MWLMICGHLALIIAQETAAILEHVKMVFVNVILVFTALTAAMSHAQDQFATTTKIMCNTVNTVAMMATLIATTSMKVMLLGLLKSPVIQSTEVVASLALLMGYAMVLELVNAHLPF
mmetsp:Transcript_12219/g.22909  ORF Transcript_12219/g.22909 Transcript_12219/m.22909 type:complete len:117 (-) Transcript_12219:2004-2354(-)